MLVFESNDDARIKVILRHLQAGCYANGLREYLTYYSKDRIGIFLTTTCQKIRILSSEKYAGSSTLMKAFTAIISTKWKPKFDIIST